MSVIVRKAGRRDLEAIHALWRQLRELRAKIDSRLAPTEDSDDVVREHREIVLADPRTAFFVGEEKGEVLAFLHAQVDTNEQGYNPARFGTVVDVFVREDRRREEIGSKLLDYCKEWFRSAGLTEYRVVVPVQNDVAQGFLQAADASPLLIAYRGLL